MLMPVDWCANVALLAVVATLIVGVCAEHACLRLRRGRRAVWAATGAAAARHAP